MARFRVEILSASKQIVGTAYVINDTLLEAALVASQIIELDAGEELLLTEVTEPQC